MTPRRLRNRRASSGVCVGEFATADSHPFQRGVRHDHQKANRDYQDAVGVPRCRRQPRRADHRRARIRGLVLLPSCPLVPYAAPRLCTCGRVVPAGQRCQCAAKRKAEADARRPPAQARGYGQSWRDARAAHLAAHPQCVRCGGRATLVDHRIPHRGDMKLFWRRDLWDSMCTSCHSRWKQRDEHGL